MRILIIKRKTKIKTCYHNSTNFQSVKFKREWCYPLCSSTIAFYFIKKKPNQTKNVKLSFVLGLHNIKKNQKKNYLEASYKVRRKSSKYSLRIEVHTKKKKSF